MAAPWLSDWAKRIKLTIDSTKIDGYLTNFPTLVTLTSGINATGIFNELSHVSGAKKIAMTTSNGTSQCYVEIERWDWAAEEAILWTKVPTVSSGTDTDLYLYYDSTKSDNDTYVAEPGDVVAQNVWNSDFIAVYHMSQDPSGGANSIKDSTSNINHGSPGGTMDSNDLVDGVVGKALDFDGVNDRINCGNLGSWPVSGTLSFWFEAPVLEDYRGPLCTHYADGNRGIRVSSPSSALCRAHIGDDGGINFTNHTLLNPVLVDTPYHIVIKWSTTADTISAWVNNTLVRNESAQTYWPTSIADFAPGNTYSTSADRYWKGIVDEVRVSSTATTAAWVKADYYSNLDNLVTYGAEQPIPVFLFNGYVQLEGVPVERTVCLYRRSTGELMDTTTSSGSAGYFEVGSPYNEYHYVVILPALADNYNLLGYDKIHPEI